MKCARAETSLVSPEEPLDLGKAQPPNLPRQRCVQRGHLYHRLARFGDHERFALGSLLDEPREVSGIVIDLIYSD